MVGRVNTGGGTALNFAIKPYATEAALLADTPKENTVGIVTETAITDYMFSSTQPTTRSDGSALSGGEMWIKTGTRSSVEFNALKKDTLEVYPLFARQYIGGAWTVKTAKSYIGSTWVDWIPSYYDNGTTAYTFVSNGSAGSFTQNADNLYCSCGSSNSNGAFRFVETVDFTDISTLHIRATRGGTCDSNHTAWLRVLGSAGYFWINVLAQTEMSSAITDQEVTLDVSSISGEQYISIGTNVLIKYAGTTTLTTFSIWGD